jgi:hypothetical protein
MGTIPPKLFITQHAVDFVCTLRGAADLDYLTADHMQYTSRSLALVATV